MKVVPIAAVEETVAGLFGGALEPDGTTIWCRARKVLEAYPDGTHTSWRDMTMDDVERLFLVDAIDDDARYRMKIRLMR